MIRGWKYNEKASLDYVWEQMLPKANDNDSESKSNETF